MAVFYALDIHLPVAAGLLVLFSLNLWIAIPSTPAQFGALEAGAISALQLLQVGGEKAAAFALLYHVLQVLPLIVAGLVLEYRLVLGREGDLRSNGTNGTEALPAPPKAASPAPSGPGGPPAPHSSVPSTPHPAVPGK
jgi:hypothetical protein